MAFSAQQLPTWRCTIPVVLDLETLQTATQQIASCESCTPDIAEVPFDFVLDSVTGCDPETTDYVLQQPVRCPACGALVTTGIWRWSDSPTEGRTAYVLPGTLIVLKD